MSDFTYEKSTMFPWRKGLIGPAGSAILLLMGIIVIAAGLYEAVKTVQLVVATHTHLLQEDEWTLLQRYTEFTSGRQSLLSFLWEQHNEHRPVLARLLFMLDANIASGTQVVTKTASLVVCGLLAAFFSTVVLQLKQVPWGARLIGVGLMIILFLSNQQMENLIRGFNNQLLTATFFSVLALYLLLKSIGEDGSNRREGAVLASALASGILATYSMANGLLVWPVMLLACLRFRSWRRAAIVGIVGTAAIATYLWHYARPPHHPNPLEALNQPVQLARYFVAFIGNPGGSFGWRGATLLGALALALVAYHFCRQALFRDKDAHAVWFVLSVCLFVLGTAALTSVGRLGIGLEFALSPRYSSFVLPLWAAVLVLGLLPLDRATQTLPRRFWSLTHGAASALSIGLCGSVFFGQSWGSQWSPLVRDLYQRGASAIIAGAPDRVVLGALFPSPEYLLGLVPYLAEHRLSIFHSSTDLLLYRTVRGHWQKPLSEFKQTGGKWCAGYIDGVTKVSNVGSSLNSWYYVWGWTVDRERGSAADAVLFADGEGRLVGLARLDPARRRMDVEQALNLKVKNLTVQFAGYVQVEAGRPVVGFALQSERDDLCRFHGLSIGVQN